MRSALLLVLAAAIACTGGGIDPDLDPQSLWIHEPPPPAPQLPEGVRVRALTLNVHGGSEATPERLAEVFSPLMLDVVALQESPGAEFVARLGAALGLGHHAGGEGIALLSRTVLTATRAISFRAGRSALRAETVIGGAPFVLYGVHLGWNAAGDRQARELVEEHLRREPEPRLLMLGDFNDEHLSSQAAILETEVEDVFTALGWYPGQRVSWPSTGFDGSEGSQLIDLIYYRRSFPALVLQAGVINTVPVLSDHKPSWAELTYPAGERPFASDPFEGRREPWAAYPLDPAENLLVNPGAEEGATGWTPDNGGEIAEGPRENQAPHSGQRHFTGATQGDDLPVAVSGWSQRVDLSASAGVIDGARGWLVVAGWIATGHRIETEGDVVSNLARPYDEGEVVLELDDGAGAILARWTSGRRDPLRPHPFAERIAVAPGTRGATIRLLSHLELPSGGSHDALFDDLHLSFEPAERHHVAGAALAAGAEAGDVLEGTWQVHPDGAPIGLMVYPPRSRSMRASYVALPEAGAAEGRLEAELDRALLDEIDRGELGLELGFWARTFAGRGSVELALEIHDGASLWAVLALPEVRVAEWVREHGKIRLPPGARKIALRARASPDGEPVFADDLTAVPIRLR